MTLRTNDGVTEGCTLRGLSDSRRCREDDTSGKSGCVIPSGDGMRRFDGVDEEEHASEKNF